MHRVRAPDRRRRRLGEPEVADLAGGDELGHRPHGLLDRDPRVDPVLVVEVDPLDAEPLERGVAGLANVLGIAADAERLPGGAADLAELGRDHDLGAATGDRPSDQPLVGAGPVHVRGVEHRHPQVEGAPDRLHGFALVGVAVEGRHAHAAEADRPHLELRAERPGPHRHSASPSGSVSSARTRARNSAPSAP
jgi:hypothetical protein